MKWLVAKPRLETTLNARTGVPVKAQLKYPERELGEISAISVRKYSIAIREFRGGNQTQICRFLADAEKMQSFNWVYSETNQIIKMFSKIFQVKYKLY